MDILDSHGITRPSTGPVFYPDTRENGERTADRWRVVLLHNRTGCASCKDEHLDHDDLVVMRSSTGFFVIPIHIAQDRPEFLPVD